MQPIDFEPLKKITVLYVDDEEEIVAAQNRILSRYTTVITACDGEDALEKLSQNQIDIVVTDIRMPKMDGIELLGVIRERYGSLPVVITSAFSDERYMLKAIELGAQRYLIKPVESATLKKILLELGETLLLKRNFAKQEKLLKEYRVALDKVALVSQATTDGKIFYANDNFLEISGFSLQELQTDGYTLVSHPDTPSSFFNDIKNTIKEHKIWHGVIKNLSKDKKEYFVESTIIPIDDHCVICFDYEVTEREVDQIEKNKKLIRLRAKQHEESLQLATSLNQTIAHQNQEIIALKNECNKYQKEISFIKAKAAGAEEQLIKLTAQNETLATNHKVTLGKISQLEDRNRQLNRLLESFRTGR